MRRKIKSRSIYRYNYVVKNINADQVDLEEYLSQYLEYDQDGNELLEINYTPDGVIQDKTEKKYDEQGRMIEQKYYDGEDLLAEHLTFERDNEGKIHREFMHYLDGSKDTTFFNYNTEGQLISKITKDEEDQEESREEYTYQHENRIKYEKHEEGELKKKEESRFDEKGNLVESIVTDHEQQDYYSLKHEYDGDKRIRTFRYHQDGKLIEKLEFRYDDGNIKLVQQETAAGKVIQQFEHDEKGNTLKQEEFNSDNQLNNSIERNYDEEGNPLETKVYINLHGQGIDRNYILKYKYEFYDE
ncbi:MAG: hypothetical protein K9G58_16205 [Bacteroidales bacterium]|nr:hypothetical protein [Bacteroidales bacterium]MCF8389023.1 hypothetical protein [Bacteroidales bacterium]MCF8399712.1 hypothetical protein [Bacteroidales bacterium]